MKATSEILDSRDTPVTIVARTANRRGGAGVAAAAYSAVILFTLAITASSAHAEARVGFAVAGGVVTGPVSWEGPGALDPATLHLRGRFTAPMLGVRVAVMAGEATRVGVAFGASGAFRGHARVGRTSFDRSGQLDATLRGSIRLQDRFSLRAGAGGAVAALVGGGPNVLTNDNVVETERLLGPVGDVALGYEIDNDFNVVLEVRASYLRSEHTTYIPLTATVALTWGP